MSMVSKEKRTPAWRLWTRAVKVAGLKLRFQPERKITENCEMAGMSLAEAFKAGAGEAQQEIQRRLALCADKAWRDAAEGCFSHGKISEVPK